RALGVTTDDEVITTPFTFVATAEVIAMIGAKPVFCDIEPKTMNIDHTLIEKHITDKTRVLLPVHLYGQSADMDPILAIAKKHNIAVVEDMAQAVGAQYKGKNVGTFGATACISFFPTKNLSALGDAGMVLTSDDVLAERLRAMRVHGAAKKYYHDFIGYNDRLDAVQAAFLSVKLNYLDTWNERRREIARQYDDGLKTLVQIPFIHPHNVSVYHQYTIRTQKRDALRDFLTQKGIGTSVHYPLGLHQQKAFEYLRYREGDYPEAEKAAREVLSLPIQQDLSDEEVDYVIASIKEFFSRS
ncbi:transcriptional regulator, partial [candidate division WOR_3 bacterium SM23_60]